MAEDAAAATNKRPRQGRSPAYPSLHLKEAIAKARLQYDKEGKYPAPMVSAFSAWGFSVKSSGGRSVRASLKYFGLATVEGDNDTGKVKLTEDALRIILDEREDQTEKKQIIKKLALLPVIHQALVAEFPHGIKSDPTAEHFLVFEHGYNKSAAAEVVAEFKATADFAELFKPDSMVGKSDPVVESDVQQKEEQNGSVGEIVPPKNDPPPPPPPHHGSQVKLMDGERIVFTEEGEPNQYLKLVASGEVDDVLLEALEDFVKRQRKRLAAPKQAQPRQDVFS